jgi:uncharacterized membrane protein
VSSGNKKPRTGITIFIALGVLIVILGVLVRIKLDAPLTYWDSVVVDWSRSQSWASPPVITSPFYLIALKALTFAECLSVANLRWFQAVGAALTGILVFLLSFRLWGTPIAGLIASSLYLLNPAVTQGTQSLDLADSSFLPAAFTLWFLAYISPVHSGWRRFARIAFCSAVAIGWKTTSSLGFLFYPVAEILVSLARSKGGFRRQTSDLIAITTGFLLFGIPFWTVQNWITFNASLSSAHFSLKEMGSAAFYAALSVSWLGPTLVFLALLGAIHLWKQGNSRSIALIVGTTAYALVYLFVGGMNHGYPRYHLAVFPVLCSLAAGSTTLEPWKKHNLGILLILAVVFGLVIADPIYALNAGLRAAAVNGTVLSFVLLQALRWILLLGLLLSLKRVPELSWHRLLLLATWASLLAIGVIQCKATYRTAYSYGEEGRAEVLAWVQRNAPPGASLVCPPDITPEVQRLGYRGPGHSEWGTQERVLSYINETHPKAIVLGLTSNTHSQLEWLLRQPPSPFSSCPGHYTRIGSYWVCAADLDSPASSK